MKAELQPLGWRGLLERWRALRPPQRRELPVALRELLAAHFNIRADEPLKGGKRHIYFAEARA